MGYVDDKKLESSIIKGQLSGGVADAKKSLVPPVPKLTVPAPSIGGTAVFTCTPNFDAIKNAFPPLPQNIVPTFNYKTPPNPFANVLNNLPTRQDILNKIPASVRNAIAKMIPPPTVEEILAYARQYAPPIPPIPPIPVPKVLEDLKTFCKPPQEAPEVNAILPKVETKTIESSSIVNGTLVTTTQTVTVTSSPMDKAGVNDKAQIAILGEVKRQQVVKELILDIDAKLPYLTTFATHLNDLHQFYLTYSNINNHPDGNSSILNKAQAWLNIFIEYNSKLDAVIHDFEIIQSWFYSFKKKVLNVSKYPDLAQLEANTLDYFNGFIYNNLIVSSNDYDFLTKEANLISDTFSKHSKSLLIYHDDDNYLYYPKTMIDFKVEKEEIAKYFNNKKCNIWKYSGTENAFETLMFQRYESGVRKVSTSVKVGMFLHSEMYFSGDYDSFNFTCPNFPMITKFLETNLTILKDKLRKSLPPQG